jgi:hypothetical protein
MKKILSIIILFIMGQFAFGQILPQWIATYGGNTNLFYDVDDMVTDKAGNSYVLGYEHDTISGCMGKIIKYDTDGNQLWLHTIAGLGPYNKINTDKEGNVYVICRYDTNASMDFLTIKYNPNGELKWKAVLNGPSNANDEPEAITFDDSLNVYVTGASSNTTYSFYDYTTVKYDSSGNQKWVAFYDSNTDYPNDHAYAIAVDSLHNVYVTGSSYDTLNGNVLTIKYDPSGNQVWTRRLPSGVFSYGKFIDISSDGYIYVGGALSAPGHSDYLCIKYDTEGNKIWDAKYNAQDSLPWNGWDTPRDMKLDKNGNVYFTGTQFDGNGESDDYCTVKFSKDGVLKWVKAYNGGTSWDDAFSLAVDNNSNVYVFGQSQDSIYGHTILVTIKYDSTGNVLWNAKFVQTLMEVYRATSIGLDSLNNVYVSGTCTSLNSPHFVTLKYSFYTGIFEEGENISFNMFPNPVSDNLTIETPQKAAIEIFNIEGQLIRSIAANNVTTTIDVSGFASGIYFIRAIMEKGVAVKKFVKQ